MVETELGEWRRSHYSTELDPSLTESDVTVMGWISSVRSHGNITFLTIVDKMGEVQIVAKKGSGPDDLIENLSKLKEHSSVGLIGTVKASEKAPNGVEIIPNDLRIFSSVEKIPPFDPYAKTIKNIDTRLEIRQLIYVEVCYRMFSMHEVMCLEQSANIFMITILLKSTLHR